MLALVLFVYVFTSTEEWGDTPVYVASVLDATRSGSIGPLFEFGHLLWRPLGFVLYHLLPAFGPPQATASLILVSLNLLSGAICAFLFLDIARMLSGSEWTAFLVAASFFCANAFVTWGQTGSSYVPGLCLFSAAVWLLLRALYGRGLAWPVITGAGLLMAFSALMWFPYITAAAGAAAIVLFLDPKRADFRGRLGWAALLALVTTLVLLVAFGAAIRIQGFSSSADVKAWIQSASHGSRPSIAIPRMILGFPRSFINMGRDGMMFKRYMLHDPYARVTLAELIGVSLVRLALVYAFLAYVFVRLTTLREGRTLLVIFFFALAPLLFFALVLFESSDTERYFPIYPFLLMLVAFVMGRPANRQLRGVLAVLIAIACVSNLWSYSSIRAHSRDQATIAALTDLKSRINENSVVWVSSTSDPILTFAMGRPFHPLNQPQRFPVRQLILTRTDHAPLWRQDFAKLSLEALRQGGSVWVSNHLLAPVPQRDWNWTEGDIPGLRWTDLPQFFHSLGLSESGGPPDGFSQLQPSPATLAALESISQSNVQP